MGNRVAKLRKIARIPPPQKKKHTKKIPRQKQTKCSMKYFQYSINGALFLELFSIFGGFLYKFFVNCMRKN